MLYQGVDVLDAHFSSFAGPLLSLWMFLYCISSAGASLIQVLWEDDFMAVIVKPQGVAVRP